MALSGSSTVRLKCGEMSGGADHQIGDTVRDIPLSFNPERREYGWRDVTTTTIVVDNPNGSDEPDWFAGLEGA